MQLKILASTILKQSTAQSSMLAADQKQSVQVGDILELNSYQHVDANHLQVTLLSQIFKDKATWYVFAPHVELVGTQAAPNRPMLKIATNTVLKQRPVQSAELSDADKQSVSAGTELILHSYQQAEGNHIKFALLNRSYKGKNTWFAFAPHVELRPVVSQSARPSTRTVAAASKQVTPPQDLSKDEIYDRFFQLLQENQGRITLMQFAIATRLSGEEATEYLDKQAIEFNANFDVDEQGNIFYVFSL